MNGSAGFTYFNELIAKIEGYNALLSKRAKLKKAALKRAAVKKDIFSDWTPMINQAFELWESAL